MVQNACAVYYNWETEIYVKGELGRGYLDLYDPNNNCYYEVKSEKEAYKSSTVTQMQKYDVAKVQDTFGNRLKLTKIFSDDSPDRGTTSAFGYIHYGIYDVEYHLEAPGLIVYKTDVNWDRAVAYVSAAVLAALVIAFPESAPVAIPAAAAAFA